MVARENFESIAGTCGKKMAMSFFRPGDGQITSSRQQRKAEERGSQVRNTHTLTIQTKKF